MVEQGVVHVIRELGGCEVGLPPDREGTTRSLREYARRRNMVGLKLLDPSTDDLGEWAKMVAFADREYDIKGPVFVGTHRRDQVLLGVSTLYGLPAYGAELGNLVVEFPGRRLMVRRRPNFNFREMRLPDEAILVSVDTGEKATTIDERMVRFRDEEVTLTQASRIAKEVGYSPHPMGRWTFEGRKLVELYDETYGRR